MTASLLPAALRAGADGLYTLEAATGLIIAHASWLARGDFAPFIHHGAGTAAIDWETAISALDAGGLPSSGGFSAPTRARLPWVPQKDGWCSRHE